ncbi:MAG: hypothetical protein A2V74_00245 [Acidobacteria bacterium RBG_16_70_10]|nr:MAG: hypothetical protein A2V74_00245 [Acidobacteria bacterium RBG_16_70_10]
MSLPGYGVFHDELYSIACARRPGGASLRITVKKESCISCGKRSTYCEMGIDVRAYAMANEDVKRAACVGSGMCAHVCPRGVLKLENKPVRWKAGQPIRVYAVNL